MSKFNKKKDKVINERKRKFDNLMNKIKINNLPLSKLSLAQLQLLCQHKKRKDDKVSITKLKRDELLQLWMIWKDRCDEDKIEAVTKKMRPSTDASETRISTARSACTDDTVMTSNDELNIDINVNDNPIDNNYIDI